MRTFLTVAAALLAFTIVPRAQQAPVQGRGGRGGGQPVQPIQKIKTDLYVVPGGGSNSIVRVTSDGVILVDTKLPGAANYDDLMTQIRSVTDKPVKWVIVTHHHADHTGNDDRFIAAGAMVLGHQVLASNLKSYKFDPLPAPPSVTYNTPEHSVRLGNVEVKVYHFGRSHTGGDSVVYFPDAKVVATSDAVTVGAQGPLVDYAGGGSAIEWKRVLDSMLKLDFDTAIPGAGAPMTRADVMAFQTKFNTVVDRASALVKQGIAKDQLLMKIETADIGWAPRIPDVDAFYDELSKAAR